MIIPKQSLAFAFGAVDQATGAKHLRIGDLVSAVNVRQDVRGAFTKRRGYDRIVPSFSGASWTGPAESLLPGDGASLLARDAADTAWSYDQDDATFYERGRLRRALPRKEVVMPIELPRPKPIAILVGGNIWSFAVSDGPAAGEGGYYYSVADATSGTTIMAQTWRAANDTDAISSLDATYDGTYVWVFFATGRERIMAHRYGPASPSSAPVESTYHTVPGTHLWRIECRRLSAIGETAVVASGTSVAADSMYAVHSYLNPSTGQARSTPAPVATSYSRGAGAEFHGAGILVSTGSGGSWYYAIWRPDPSDSTKAIMSLITVNASTLAIASTTTLITETGFSVSRTQMFATGYVAANGDQVVYGMAVTGSSISRGAVKRHIYNGTSVATTVIARHSWLASKPALYDGSWWLLIGFDDPAVTPVTTAGLQRTLFFIDGDGVISASIGHGEMAGTGHRAAGLSGSAAAENRGNVSSVPDLLVVGNELVTISASTNASVNTVAPTQVRIDMAATYGKPVVFSGRAIAPGGVPVTWSRRGRIHEAGPLTYPYYVRRTSGGGTGTTAVAAMYVINDPDGTQWRSSPVLVAVNWGPGDTVAAPTLKHLLPGTEAYIHFYAGVGAPQFQGAVRNDSTVDEVSFVLPNPLRVDEILYTTGGALSVAPPTPARAVAIWRGRSFYAYGSTVWVSKEIEGGFAPELNEALTFQFPDGSGDIMAMAAIDWNYMAIFKRDAIAVISGPGPDGRGAGNYVVQTLPTKMGCGNPASVVSGPAGCFFQDHATGRVCVVTPMLQALEAAPGLAAYASEIISAAAHVEMDRMIQFWTANRIMVLDYRHATETMPFGQAYIWSGSGLAQGYGACSDSAGPVHIESSGVLRRPANRWTDATGGAAAPYAESIVTGHLHPGGLQGEFDVSRVQFLGTYRANHTVQITTYPDYSTSGTAKSLTITAEPAQVATRPPGCARIQALQLKIEELTPGDSRGFDFEGVALELQIRGRAKHINRSQVI